MTPADVERVFGRSRLQIATGRHVEVFREVARSGEERRYTKRFLATDSVDFRPWTEREYQVLVRLGRLEGAPVAKALDFLPADASGAPRLQTRDAGATLDQWATLVPLRRGETTLRNVFDDCANWWALARQCVVALDALHALGFVHLDLKPDNVCIPWAPAGAGRPVAGQPLAPRIKALALIDVAFSLVPEVDLPGPLPLLARTRLRLPVAAPSPCARGGPARQPGGDAGARLALRLLQPGRDAVALPARGRRRSRLGLEQRAPCRGAGVRPAAARRPQRAADDPLAAPPPDPPGRAAPARSATCSSPCRPAARSTPSRELPLDAEPTPPTRIADYVPRKPEPEPAAAGGGDRVASAPLPLGETRREPTAEPMTPAPAPAPAPASTAPASAAPASTAARDARREPVVPPVAPAAPSAPEVAAAYSRFGDLYEPTAPSAGDTAPGPRADTPPDPAPAGDEASNDAAPVRIRPRRRQTAIAALATGGLVVAAIAALWLSIGRSLDPATTVSIPLPSASEVALPSPTPAPPARSGASTPVVVATMPQGAPPATPSEETRPPSSAAPPAGDDRAAVRGRCRTVAGNPPSPGAVAPGATTPAPVTGESSSLPVERGVPASDELDALAADLLKNRIPASALSAERRLARVLTVAAGASEFRRRGDVRTAMQSMRAASPKVPFATPVRSDEARRLHEAALVAYLSRDDVDDAVRLQRRAFAANPLDSEVVGNLAFLQLKDQPPQAEAARQLTLHSLALNDPRFPSGRIEDWTALRDRQRAHRPRGRRPQRLVRLDGVGERPAAPVRQRGPRRGDLRRTPSPLGPGDAAAGAFVGGLRPLRGGAFAAAGRREALLGGGGEGALENAGQAGSQADTAESARRCRERNRRAIP